MRQFPFILIAFFMFCTPVLAAEDIQTLEKQLQALEAELPEILKEETDLDTRQDYVNRVLDLREKIEALEGAEETNEDLAHEGRVLYLKGFYLYDSDKYDKGKGISGYVPHSYAGRSVTVCSYKCGKNVDHRTRTTIDDYPLRITPGEPFSISAATHTKLVKHAGAGWRNSSLRDATRAKTEMAFYDGPNVKVQADSEGESFDYGDGNNKAAFEIENISSVTLDFIYKGYDRETSKSGTYEYEVVRIKKDGVFPGFLKHEDPTGDIQRMDYDKREEEKGDWSHGYGFKFTVNGLTAIYDWGTEDDEPFKAEALPEDEPLTANRDGSGEEGQDRDGAEETAGKDGDKDEGHSKTTAQESAAQQAAREKDERRAHIEHWLANAQPVENADPDYRLSFDEWGRVFGSAPNGFITVSGKPDDAGADSVYYVWAKADKLASLNLCTLKDYVKTKLEGGDINKCQIKNPENYEGGGGSLSDFAGMEATKAKILIENMGVKIKWQAGSVPKNAAQIGTVEKQKPAPGTNLKKVSKVELWVYREAGKTVTVPDVVDMPYERAAALLKREGLVPAVGMTFKPRAPDRADGKVVSQQTKPGSQVAGGATVVLDIVRGDVVPMPDIVGMKYEEAAQKMKAAGLKPLKKLGPYASSPDQVNTVADTGLLPPGQPVELGTAITVTVYNTYSEKTKPRQPEKIVKSDPASAFGGRKTPAPASGTFKCDTGIPGLVLESTGRKYPDRKNGVLETDALGVKNYICRYNVQGKQRVLLVSFFDKQPATAKAEQLKQQMCSVFGLMKWGKATYISLENASLPKAVGKENVSRFYDFHFSQVAPHAISCSGGGGSGASQPQATGTGLSVPSNMDCGGTIAGLREYPKQRVASEQHSEVGTRKNGRATYSCWYKTSRGDEALIILSFFPRKPIPPDNDKRYNFQSHCSSDKSHHKSAGTGGKAMRVQINPYVEDKLTPGQIQALQKFHTNQMGRYAISCR